MIKDIINWNKIAENNKYIPILEKAMLQEELQETIEAIDNNDFTEVLDGIIDIMFVSVGTLHKIGFTEDQIETAITRIINNNYSKFQYDEKGSHICIRDKNGKIRKPEGFTPVDLSDLIPNK